MAVRLPVPRILLALLLTIVLVTQFLVLADTSRAESAWVTVVVTGKLTDTAGAAIPNADVYLWQRQEDGSWYGEENTSTNEQGLYRLEHGFWSDSYNGPYTVEADAPKFRAQFYGGWQCMNDIDDRDEAAQHSEKFSVAAGETKVMPDIKLKKYNATIKGRVTNKDGLGLSGIRVCPYHREQGEQNAYGITEVFTNSDGYYTVEVPPIMKPEIENYTMSFEHDRDDIWQSEFYNNFPMQPQWQAGQLFTPAAQAMHSSITSLTPDSEVIATANATLGPLIKESLSVVSVTPSIPKRGKPFTARLRLSPGHSVTPTVKVQFYKYSTRYKKWVVSGTSKTAILVAKKPGAAEYEITTTYASTGKYSAIASVASHWKDPNTGSTPIGHGARKSARKTFNVVAP